MRHYMRIACAASILVHLSAMSVYAHRGPFDGKHFKGRVAFSSDGNYNDEDDWGAFPVAAAMLDAFGVTDKLIHVDYCNILPKNDPRFYKEMVESVLGAAERYNLPPSVLFDCQKGLDGAVESVTKAINASSAEDPLYYALAGPMAGRPRFSVDRDKGIGHNGGQYIHSCTRFSLARFLDESTRKSTSVSSVRVLDHEKRADFPPNVHP